MRVIEARQAGMGANEWDRIVSAAPGGHLLQTWAWGELKGEFGWIPWRVAVEQDGAPLAAAQVLYRRIGPLTMAYVPADPCFMTISRRLLTPCGRRFIAMGAACAAFGSW